MITLGPCEITTILGPVASGKTFLQQELSRLHPRKVVFDATGEASANDDNAIDVWYSPKRLNEVLRKTPYAFNVCYHPGTDIVRDFYYVTKCLWRLPVDKLLVCDEVHQIYDVYQTPKFAKTVLRFARHDKLAFLAASQRTADVSKLLTEFSRQVIHFHTQEATSLKAVSDRFGQQSAEAVRNLRPLIYDDIHNKVVQKPQCIVFKKSSQQPMIYDFSTDKMTQLDKVNIVSSEDVPEPESETETESMTDAETESDL